MTRFRSLWHLGVLTVCMLVVLSSYGQDTTGIPRFGSFSTSKIDTINLANLNLHVDIPVFQKTSRGYETSWDLIYDSPQFFVNNSGSYQVVDPLNSSYFRLGQSLPGPGGVDYSTTPSPCDSSDPEGPYAFEYSNFIVYDSNNTPHVIPIYTWDNSECGGDITTASGYADDGSGYYLTATGSEYVVTDQ